MNKMLKILEVVWMLIGITGFVFCIYAFINGETEKGIYFVGFTVISGIMFYIRRRQRIRYEKNTPPLP